MLGQFKYGKVLLKVKGGVAKIVMPHIADQYRRAAEEAKQLATKATDSCERVQLLRLAAQWQRLADYKARLESKPPPPGAAQQKP